MLFNDGMVGVLIFGGVYAAGNFGWETITLLIFGLTTSVSAMIGAYLVDVWMTAWVLCAHSKSQLL